MSLYHQPQTVEYHVSLPSATDCGVSCLSTISHRLWSIMSLYHQPQTVEYHVSLLSATDCGVSCLYHQPQTVEYHVSLPSATDCGVSCLSTISHRQWSIIYVSLPSATDCRVANAISEWPPSVPVLLQSPTDPRATYIVLERGLRVLQLRDA